jgi:hypothetical protein
MCDCGYGLLCLEDDWVFNCDCMMD